MTRGFVDGLGVSVAAGRRFAEQDFVAGSEPVALIGHALWRDRFGSDPAAIGRLIRAEAESRPGRPETFRIVGVLTPGFYYGRDSRAGVDLLVPHAAPVRAYMVRLRGGSPACGSRAPPDRSRTACGDVADSGGLDRRAARVRARPLGWQPSARPVRRHGRRGPRARDRLRERGGAHAAPLDAASERGRGPSGARLGVAPHRTDAADGNHPGLCRGARRGIAITAFLLAALAPLIETQLGRPAPSASGITIDTTVLLIVGGIGLLVAVALSLAPLTSWGRGLTNALRQDGRVASEGRTMRRLRSGLIAFEIAGSLVLLVGCGLMIRSVLNMMSTDFGFDADGLSRSRIMLRARNYPDAAAYRLFHQRFAGRVSDATGSTVVFSSWATFVPPPTHLIQTDERDAGLNAGAISVSAGYFSTLGIDVRQGREFTAQEASAEAPVAVISETLARRLWPDGSAVGRRARGVEQTAGGSSPGPWRTVIGIVGDVRQTYDDVDRRRLLYAEDARRAIRLVLRPHPLAGAAAVRSVPERCRRNRSRRRDQPAPTRRRRRPDACRAPGF